jgi:hypothetical protein
MNTEIYVEQTELNDHGSADKILGDVKLTGSGQVFRNSNARYAELIEADPSWIGHTVLRLTA